MAIEQSKEELNAQLNIACQWVRDLTILQGKHRSMAAVRGQVQSVYDRLQKDKRERENG